MKEIQGYQPRLSSGVPVKKLQPPKGDTAIRPNVIADGYTVDPQTGIKWKKWKLAPPPPPYRRYRNPE